MRRRNLPIIYHRYKVLYRTPGTKSILAINVKPVSLNFSTHTNNEGAPAAARKDHHFLGRIYQVVLRTWQR